MAQTLSHVREEKSVPQVQAPVARTLYRIEESATPEFGQLSEKNKGS